MPKFNTRHTTNSVVVANGQATANMTGVMPNGILRSLCISAPTLTSASYTVTITGPATGWTLYTKPTLTPNAVTVLNADGTNLPTGGVAVDSSSTVTITTVGNEAAQRTFTVDMLVV